MKKSLVIAIIVVVAIIGILICIFAFNGDGGSRNQGNSGTNNSIELKFDDSIGRKVCYAKIKISSDDKIAEFDKNEPSTVRIENDKENYVADLTIENETKVSYEQTKESAIKNHEDNNSVYEEMKFGNYEGYYAQDNDNMYGYILLSTDDTNSYVYIIFDVYYLNDSTENKDIQSLFKCEKVQNIINNIELKTTELECKSE